MTPLITAIRHGNYDSILTLLEYGADVNEGEVMLEVIESDSLRNYCEDLILELIYKKINIENYLDRIIPKLNLNIKQILIENCLIPPDDPSPHSIEDEEYDSFLGSGSEGPSPACSPRARQFIQSRRVVHSPAPVCEPLKDLREEVRVIARLIADLNRSKINHVKFNEKKEERKTCILEEITELIDKNEKISKV